MIRLTESEQERLKAQAGREPLASYCRRELLGDYREPEEQPAGKYLDGSARLDSYGGKNGDTPSDPSPKKSNSSPTEVPKIAVRKAQ